MSSDKPAATHEPAEQLTGVIRDAPAGVAEELRDGETASERCPECGGCLACDQAEHAPGCSRDGEPHYSLVVPQLSRRAGVTITATIYPAGAWKPDDDHIRYSDGGSNVWSDEKDDAAVAVALVALLRDERAVVAGEPASEAAKGADEALAACDAVGVVLSREGAVLRRLAAETSAMVAPRTENAIALLRHAETVLAAARREAETKRALESARETLRLTAEAGVRLQGERDAAERRASEAEARATRLVAVLLAVSRWGPGQPTGRCWCREPRNRGHEQGCIDANRLLPAKEPTT